MLAFSVTGCFVDTTGNARPDVPLSEGGVVDGSARVDSAVDAAVDAGMDADASCDDRDGDGVCDGDDGCPDDMDKTEPGMCGCGTPDTDSDGDSVADCIDMCDGGDDRVDDDGDGLRDYPFDPGCTSPEDQTERTLGSLPQCADGVDNDEDE